MTATAPTKKWIKDANGNRCSVEHWGSVEDAQKALDSLVNCSDCSDCRGCSDCRDCSRCRGCRDCSGCSYCSYCSYCSGCSYCSDCRGCSDCSGCSYCSQKPGKIEGKGRLAPPTPIIPNIHQTIYAAASRPEALAMETWHTCTETHCRAGWVVTLAGEAGKALESFFDTTVAAMKIYDASSALERVSPVRFFETNEQALADMKRMADLEAAQ